MSEQTLPQSPDYKKRYRWSLWCAAAMLIPSTGLSQNAAPTTATREHIETIEKKIQETADGKRSLTQSIEAIQTEQKQLLKQLIDSSQELADAEDNLLSLEKENETIRQREAALETALSQQKNTLADILAAASNMGRNPPPALLVKTDDAMEAIRTAMLLETILPDMHQRLIEQTHQQKELAQARKDKEEGYQRAQLQQKDIEQRRRQIAALHAKRKESLDDKRERLSSLDAQSVKLAQEAASLRDLLSAVEKQDSTTTLPKAAGKVHFSHMKGRLPKPVAGDIVLAFGQTSAQGQTEKGLTLRTAPGNMVLAPVEGQILFAGPFRTYGNVLIINGGEGYHVLLAGMNQISVGVGQVVLAGEPLGNVGDSNKKETAQLYIEFRKNGQPFDPRPWLAWDKAERTGG